MLLGERSSNRWQNSDSSLGRTVTDEETPATGEVLLAELRQRVESFPVDFESRLDEPLERLLSHVQLQALILACGILIPGVPRELFGKGSTGRDLLHLLDSSAATGRASAKRISRGSYTSADVTLRPIVEQDLPALYRASFDPESTHRWRFRGQTLSPEVFRRALFSESVLAQFMVQPIAELERRPAVGLVSAYNADHNAGYCYAAFQRTAITDRGRTAPDLNSTAARPSAGLMVEGMLIFLAYLFDHFSMRKIYVEIPDYNLPLVAGVSDEFLVREGLLRDHYFYGNRHWDLHIFAIYRQTFVARSELFRHGWDDDPDGAAAEGERSVT